jgi:hypothetical protein
MVDGVNFHIITRTLNPKCKNNRIMLRAHVLEQHHHALYSHFTRITMLTNSDDIFNICRHQELVIPIKKPNLTYHQLKKVIHAKQNYIDMFST